MKMQKIRYAILIADLLWVMSALSLGILLRYAGTREAGMFSAHFQSYSPMILAATIAWVLLYFEMSLDGFKGGWHLSAILSQLTVAVCLMMIAVLAFCFVIQMYYSRLVMLFFAVFFFLGVVILRCAARYLVSSRLRNTDDDRCVILGQGPVARELASKIASHPELPFRVVGFLFPGEAEAVNGFAASLGTPQRSVKTLQVLELLAKQKVQKLIIAMAQPNGAEVRKLIAGCRKESIRVYLVPEWYDLYLSKAELVEIDGLPMVSMQERNPPARSFALKRAIDVVISLGILAVVWPLLLLAAGIVYRKTGKAFRAEERCGKDGRAFGMYRLNVDRHAVHRKPYERLLVRWSLTELPQLWNVLRGEMSLVGPRPESADRVKYYSDWQRQRLKVQAGVTGLAQVHGLRDQHSSEDKSHFDLQYIVNWSPLFDLSLIMQTVWTLLFRGLIQEPVDSPIVDHRAESNDRVTLEIVDANRS